MQRDIITYMNARKAAKAASGGAKQDLRVKYAPQREADAADKAMAIIGAFSLWAETTRQVLCNRLAIPQQESCDEIPF